MSDTVKEKGWGLYFHSGSACCIIENGNAVFNDSDFYVEGCMAVLKI